ncbi:MAG: tRNA (adenosine(37)-N6)-threonylcarbamoyltransferase complex transferase subunit TsaD [Candidatus Yanofskybacteria bacterium RIFCSPHIGHO2_01_FULL_43_42]|uniref:tRNA N6-adenosine threonylcarbamoyltransferase n=1 Tax=Candidatus Yanofskybacteria bacterium RIFCSPLOWO2_01_FULL_43_22 TaxID=1802695 RepID=A0A1F8GH68_9BACT|nr:MAG: tRNA (adenosine(37)-N6)-threonylcarbamoyltransferase complex transferase subunit TsaD [Candidatus Yanofskybacteria bacterium RIFCSPHIGHO2_01_FULL_43_42]OGN13045.1 MAG: tRNA (adenosine(37)-N6)-threonylcarbamoyltransferase complex transferase subunit TsaD [Candidatus Yanofskybacteria bacterium RIFCSPHIGHO2_02_FULL_43_17]OGN24026.1 MAG: tRNA (adenosine(37)-N6)-threonylcarbamoyltransferase complex transferase subunit TsaD [Candidatus Yanofskybacteria bacterium RIFCSPLOWO2_01_FULL_43_22]
MMILGIETSCDETAIAVLEIKNGKITVLSNTVSSQVKLHAKFGGVVPNLAAREHAKNIGLVFKLSLKKAGVKDFGKEIRLITVTRGPGLGPSLLVGLAFARTIAWKYNKPLIGVNHLEGHIYSNWLKPVGVNSTLRSFSKVGPVLNLIVSGGHTELVLMKGHGKYKIIGETLDDAVGEAFDKVARLLGLGYPGGPMISKIAERGDSTRFPLPRPMLNSKNFDFSYSGLKTAVLYLLRDLKESGEKINKQTKADIAASFQKAATDVLVFKTIKAVQEYKVKSLFLSGGVSANKELRKRLATEAKKIGIKYSQPEMEYTGDNAAMIAVAGYFKVKSKNEKVKTDWGSIKMDANLGF